ncbi:MAG: TolC family protein [Elusimicrobia bacterium]|nr:TolC family protein [Elusimicrobiota bacterium]
MRFTAVVLGMMFVGVSAGGLEAVGVSSGTISLQRVLEAVRRDNPEILAARKRWEAARQRAAQAATPDKPRLDLERMFAPSGENVVSMADEKAIAVTQEVPFPTTLYLRRGAALKDAAIKEQSYKAKLLDVASRARAAYAELFLAGKGLTVFDENIGIMRRFSRVAESKVAAGKASQSDALKAQVELTRMLNMRVELEAELESSKAMLNALMGRDAWAPLGAPEEPASAFPPRSPEDLESEALSGRPEVREAALAYDRAGDSLSLARSEFLPDLMLQYRRRSDPMRGRTHDAVLGLSLPLWFWKPAAMVREARNEREMAQAELQAARVATRADVKAAWSKARASRSLIEAYRTTLLPQAESSLRVAEAGYQAEKTGFLDLLDAQRSLLSFKLEYYRHIAEFETRVAELERVVGGAGRPPSSFDGSGTPAPETPGAGRGL